ncbi:hypothetical protein AK812_SmicGene44809 [Symbiodinium microadriaticum]|uniref:Uncharacterized protein n=1 Tax=Symbiodinium microadriaticum TaxID=2951 RepID=A0A1Q9BXJ4_SYMMI|nr:hypothetical protein AK812_SmicGene44809 [Symbiodinium microadriaticum]CAE7472202.1 unnamed protein product [Symbiodinium microadriaticum]
MTLVNLVGVQQGGLLGGRHHVPDKLRIFRILVLFLQLVRLREEGDTFVLPESAPRAYGRARDQLVKRIGPRTWYPLLSRQHRFRYHPYDHWDGRGKPLLPWMKLALTRPPLPLMGIKAAPRCLLMMNRTEAFTLAADGQPANGSLCLGIVLVLAMASLRSYRMLCQMFLRAATL